MDHFSTRNDRFRTKIGHFWNKMIEQFDHCRLKTSIFDWKWSFSKKDDRTFWFKTAIFDKNWSFLKLRKYHFSVKKHLSAFVIYVCDLAVTLWFMKNAHLKDLKHLKLIDKEGLILKMHVIHEKYHVITFSQS